jgi:hypothetical protein
MAYIRRPFIGNIMTVHSAHRPLSTLHLLAYIRKISLSKILIQWIAPHYLAGVPTPDWYGAPCVKKNKPDVIRKLVKDGLSCKSPAENPKQLATGSVQGILQYFGGMVQYQSNY